MDISQQIVAKVRALSSEAQREVLAFIEKLESKEGQVPRTASYGNSADLRMDLSLEEFARNRREMWGEGTDTEMDR